MTASLQVRLADALSLFPETHPHIDTHGLDYGDWLDLADVALATLGLDDLDAAVQRAMPAAEHWWEYEDGNHGAMVRAVLGAALSARGGV